MFLTKMQINPRRRASRQLLASPQAMHAAVMAGFANPQPTAAGRLLWRVDAHDTGRVLLFVASPERPDFSHIAEDAGWPTTEAWQSRPYSPLLDSLRAGQHWQFRLTANPVRSGRREGWDDTKPLAHVTTKQQEQWLLDRADKAGFRLAPRPGVDSVDGSDAFDLAVVGRSTTRFRRQGSTVTIARVTFEGHLEITDPESFRRCLTAGMGRAKAYGCGLLTIARVPSIVR